MSENTDEQPSETTTVRVPNVTPGAVSGLDHSPLYGEVEVAGGQLRPLDDDEERDEPFDPAKHTDAEVDAYLDSLDPVADADEYERVVAAVDGTSELSDGDPAGGDGAELTEDGTELPVTTEADVSSQE